MINFIVEIKKFVSVLGGYWPCFRFIKQLRSNIMIAMDNYSSSN
ncbi:MAG: hypothetical protein ACTMUB_06465 [cyanobacterium endosymbiont of Rhopalodia musculus]